MKIKAFIWKHGYLLLSWLILSSMVAVLWLLSTMSYTSYAIIRETNIVPYSIGILLVCGISALLFSALSSYRTLRRTKLVYGLIQLIFLHFPCMFASAICMYGAFIFLTWV